jgi:hypothetical protein
VKRAHRSPAGSQAFRLSFPEHPSDIGYLAQQTILKGLAHIDQFVECRAFSID